MKQATLVCNPIYDSSALLAGTVLVTLNSVFQTVKRAKVETFVLLRPTVRLEPSQRQTVTLDCTALTGPRLPLQIDAMLVTTAQQVVKNLTKMCASPVITVPWVLHR